MTKEMVISTNRHETKVAVLEDDQLVEVYFQRANEYSLAGSIHKGRVTRVLPGMQSAFVDLGLERDTFLYVSDFFEENEEFDSIPPERERRPSREDRPRREESKETPVQQEAAVAVDEPPAEPAAEMAEAGPEAGAAAETAASDRGTRPDRAELDRDRHRRSRRRRNRGRGFPESKYASPSHTPVPRPAAEPVEPAEAEPESAAAQPSEFSILPGESLAKYRHTAVPTLDSGELEELGAASPEAEHTAEQAMPDEAVESESVPEAPGAQESAIAPDPTPALAPAPESGAEPRPSEPDLSRSEPEPDPGEMVVEEDERTTDAEALLTEVSEVDELVAEALAEADDSFDPAAGAEPEAEPDVLPETAAENEAVAGEHLEAPPESAGADSTAAAPAPAGPVEASVRENSGRYIQHRISRRMRRRMRSQGRGEGEPRREGEAAPPVATEATPAIHPEGRPEPRPEAKRDARSESRPDRGDTRAVRAVKVVVEPVVVA